VTTHATVLEPIVFPAVKVVPSTGVSVTGDVVRRIDWNVPARLQQPSWLEWVGVVLPMFLFGNWAEWAAHRYLLHSPRSLLKPESRARVEAQQSERGRAAARSL